MARAGRLLLETSLSDVRITDSACKCLCFHFPKPKESLFGINRGLRAETTESEGFLKHFSLIPGYAACTCEQGTDPGKFLEYRSFRGHPLVSRRPDLLSFEVQGRT